MASVLRSLALLVLLATLVAGFSAWLHPGRPPWTKPLPEGAIDAAMLAAWLAAPVPPLVLDARAAADHSAGTVPGAVPYNDHSSDEALVRLADSWQGPVQRIVVFCGSDDCNLSRDIALQLKRDLGFSEVYYLDGGWDAWRRHSR